MKQSPLIPRIKLVDHFGTSYRTIVKVIDQLGIKLHPIPFSSRGKGIKPAGVKRLAAFFEKNPPPVRAKGKP